jgi:hypothetical protein
VAAIAIASKFDDATSKRCRTRFSIIRAWSFELSNIPHALNYLPPLIDARSCFQTPLDCPVAEATKHSKNIVSPIGTMPHTEMKLPVSHHLKSLGAYGIDDLSALTRVGNLEFLLKKNGRLLV